MTGELMLLEATVQENLCAAFRETIEIKVTRQSLVWSERMRGVTTDQ